MQPWHNPPLWSDHICSDDRRGRRRCLFQAERAVGVAQVLTESEVNGRLAAWAPGGDVALLRRRLVDHGILERTLPGSEYALAPE
jgi:hypothetical protein